MISEKDLEGYLEKIEDKLLSLNTSFANFSMLIFPCMIA